jgi:hypothetical protein
MVVLDTLTVLSYSFDSHNPLAGAEKPRNSGQVWHQDKEDDTPRQADRSEYEEDILPRRQTSSDVPDSIPQKPTDYTGNTVHAVVGHHAQGLFVRLVPHGKTQNKTWIHYRLEYPK